MNPACRTAQQSSSELMNGLRFLCSANKVPKLAKVGKYLRFFHKTVRETSNPNCVQSIDYGQRS